MGMSILIRRDSCGWMRGLGVTRAWAGVVLPLLQTIGPLRQGSAGRPLSGESGASGGLFHRTRVCVAGRKSFHNADYGIGLFVPPRSLCCG